MAVYSLPDDHLNVGVLVHDGGVVAAQLEEVLAESLGHSHGNLPADLGMR